MNHHESCTYIVRDMINISRDERKYESDYSNVMFIRLTSCLYRKSLICSLMGILSLTFWATLINHVSSLPLP